MDEQDKKAIEEQAEEKKKKAPWWQNLHPLVLGGAAVAVFLIIQSIMMDTESRGTYLFWLIAIIAILYIMSQSPKAKEGEILSPREAELLVERECERKKLWGQFGPMAKYTLLPVSRLQHRDGGGIYYEVGVRVSNMLNKGIYYCGTVMARGIEKGFVTLQESIGPLHGREWKNEYQIIPEIMKRARKYPLLEKIMLREKWER